MVAIETISGQFVRDNAPLFFSSKNQLRRELGKITPIYVGGDCGTVRDEAGMCWDWWLTEEVLRGGFRKIVIVPAR